MRGLVADYIEACRVMGDDHPTDRTIDLINQGTRRLSLQACAARFMAQMYVDLVKERQEHESEIERLTMLRSRVLTADAALQSGVAPSIVQEALGFTDAQIDALIRGERFPIEPAKEAA